MALALALSLLIGLSLGILGGGGSILTVPVLVYALHLDPKTAIATSLFVVAVTSLGALLPHARAGRIRWKTAAVFGGAGMVGAFGGGRLAAYIPASLLMIGFAAMMLATAVAMIRGRRLPPGAPDAAGACPPATGPRASKPSAKGRPAVGRIALDGLVVGVLTGLVGAGGGFLVVPALSLLGGLPLPVAIGTSLLVIAIKSLAGFAGHLGHVVVPWGVVLPITALAVTGSLLGARLVGRVPERALRLGFGWFVIFMALFILVRQMPNTFFESPVWHAAYGAVFVDRWPFYLGGLAIGAFVLFMLWADNKLLGVSTGCAELTQWRCDPGVRRSWRIPFLGGIVLGGLVAGRLSGFSPTLGLGQFDVFWSAAPLFTLPIRLGAGFLIGFGARAANGCTSGHGIVGVAQGARSSLVATAAFLVAGFLVTQTLLLWAA